MQRQRTVLRVTGRFERKREAILNAATGLLNAHGVRGLTLADAGAAVGLSTTSVTYYFRRKDELAAACMLRGIATLEELVAAALEERPPAARLHRLLELYVERVRQAETGEAPPLPILADLRALNPPSLEEVFGAYMKLFRRLRQIFEGEELEGLTRGRRTARAQLVLSQLFWAPNRLSQISPRRYDDERERMFDILLNGMASPGAEWAPEPIAMADLAPDQEKAQGTFLRAATRLINARGYRGASVDKISAELHVTKGSFYHHNEAKDDLVEACFQRTFEVMRRAQRLAEAAADDGWTRLATLSAALTELQLSDHGPLLSAAALSGLPDAMRERIIEDASAVAEGFRALIAAGVKDGSLRPVDPALAAYMLSAAVNAGSELAFFIPDMRPKSAPAVFARPLLMGVFGR
jgi:AcrR family transcriptional regulator